MVGAPEPGGLIEPFAWWPGIRRCRRTDLQRFQDGAVAPHQRPREIRIVAELPRTDTGKLQRFRLRALVDGR